MPFGAFSGAVTDTKSPASPGLLEVAGEVAGDAEPEPGVRLARIDREHGRERNRGRSPAVPRVIG